MSPTFIEWISRMMSLGKRISPLQTLLMVQKSWTKPLLKQCRLHRFQKHSKKKVDKRTSRGRSVWLSKVFFPEYPKITLWLINPYPPNVPYPPVRNTGFILAGLINDTVDGQNPAPPRIVIIPLFIGSFNHPRWLFGISSINSTNLFKKPIGISQDPSTWELRLGGIYKWLRTHGDFCYVP